MDGDTKIYLVPGGSLRVEVLKVPKKLIIKYIKEGHHHRPVQSKKEQPGRTLNKLVWVLTNTVVVFPCGEGT